MREDQTIWERFQHSDSYRWGGDPGEQLSRVPAALTLLGEQWLLIDVKLIGCRDVAHLRHSETSDEFWLTFDYESGSPTEGTWGYCFKRGAVLVKALYGFTAASDAVLAFLAKSEVV